MRLVGTNDAVDCLDFKHRKDAEHLYGEIGWMSLRYYRYIHTGSKGYSRAFCTSIPRTTAGSRLPEVADTNLQFVQWNAPIPLVLVRCNFFFLRHHQEPHQGNDGGGVFFKFPSTLSHKRSHTRCGSLQVKTYHDELLVLLVLVPSSSSFCPC